MGLSIFDLFKIGIGPSSSHTMGPMVASNRFINDLDSRAQLLSVHSIRIDLYGSLALTGKGHCTDTAVLLGLQGEQPELVDPDKVPGIIEQTIQNQKLKLSDSHTVDFDYDTDFHFHEAVFLAEHPNGIEFTAFDRMKKPLLNQTYFSIGGGFVLHKDEMTVATSQQSKPLPYPFDNAEQLLELGKKHQLTIAEIVLENERQLTASNTITRDLLNIWSVMEQSIERGCIQTGVLPGKLQVQRRAANIFKTLSHSTSDDQLAVLDWVNLFALAVNEENAAGGRIVTAPTNGAAGVIPAVLAYYDRFVKGSNEKGIETFLATAAAIGMLYKKNASISAAEVGCQGEIGVACSMAAGALCAVLGGDNEQVENAAEIGMEHNLGLTCDPVDGLVQVPCIERNTMGAVKAINAARLALQGTGQHQVSLDNVIKTMHQTGMDMQDKYKETALAGLAVNVVVC
ncbi:L-serine ammonia-lyase [Endozoicomonas sp. OPT23]|uniref:L-serine ammonia-lyase n=1 Tax=Endozoicomonas sp. OPT23 TaxID=2072845 RepID=UPI00129A0D09|nr:L-serine ammonia-lyase [Endozoicomonas sp. OPT23]MRI34573.1 L-serine ammonia-lyase [Endozoicomonas sp. OPT23]